PPAAVRARGAGRYVGGGVRLRVPRPAPLVSHHSVPTASPRGTADDGDPVADVRLEVLPRPDGAVRLVLYTANTAADVELAGDFTDWQPRPLRRIGNGVWETVLPIPSGMHRLNVRIDRGAWIVPVGLTRAGDDFGDEVGIVAVP